MNNRIQKLKAYNSTKSFNNNIRRKDNKHIKGLVHQECEKNYIKVKIAEINKNPSINKLSYQSCINKIGGTRSKHIYVAMGALQFICVVFGLCAPFSTSVLIFTILMSIYILVNSASGILSISASFAVMPKTLTGTATGIYSLCVNLIAFLPAPYAYAFIKNLFSDGSYIMIVLMLYGLFGCFEIMAADIYMRVKKIKIYAEEYKFVTVK